MTDVRNPDVIRKEIAETREELGAAVEELAAKTDVKARLREKLSELRRAAREHPAVTVAVTATVVMLLVVSRR